MLTSLMKCSVLLSICILLAGMARGDAFYWGRNLDHGRDKALHVHAGQVQEIEFAVEETTRKLYDVLGTYWQQDSALSVDLSDFDMKGGYSTAGFMFENAGRFMTFQFDTTLMQPSANPVAARNYYIDIGEDVEYEGTMYNQMQIPRDCQFKVDMFGGSFEIRGLVTPFTLEPVPGFRMTPWFDLGLFGFGGQYDIDAGPARGVKIYQNPPEYFVIGGKSSGLLGLALPEWGGGGELRFGGRDTVNVVLQGSATVCEFSGSSKILTVNDHREKNVDIDHKNIRGRGLLEIPLKGSRCLTLGVQYQSIASDGFVSANADTPEEVIATRERFDKKVRFRMETLQGVLGITF